MACTKLKALWFGDDVLCLNVLENNAKNSKLEDRLENEWYEDVSFIGSIYQSDSNNQNYRDEIRACRIMRSSLNCKMAEAEGRGGATHDLKMFHE